MYIIIRSTYIVFFATHLPVRDGVIRYPLMRKVTANMNGITHGRSVTDRSRSSQYYDRWIRGS